jgi:hypothetical protein
MFKFVVLFYYKSRLREYLICLQAEGDILNLNI